MWQSIAKAFLKYTADHPDCDKKTVVSRLVALTMGVTGESVEALKPYYDGIIKPLAVTPGDKHIELTLTASDALVAAMPKAAITKLATEWTEKAAPGKPSGKTLCGPSGARF